MGQLARAEGSFQGENVAAGGAFVANVVHGAGEEVQPESAGGLGGNIRAFVRGRQRGCGGGVKCGPGVGVDQAKNFGVAGKREVHRGLAGHVLPVADGVGEEFFRAEFERHVVDRCKFTGLSEGFEPCHQAWEVLHDRAKDNRVLGRGYHARLPTIRHRRAGWGCHFAYVPIESPDRELPQNSLITQVLGRHESGGAPPLGARVNVPDACLCFRSCFHVRRRYTRVMAASMYIVVEGEDPGFDIFVNGRSLARHESTVERLTLELGVKPLLEFFSADEASMALLIEEGAGNPELLKRLPPPQWYRGEDGLRTIEALVMALEEDPYQLGSEGAMVLAELREYETVLRKATDRGLRWHLAVSWK
jgi:hypothetical protein